MPLLGTAAAADTADAAGGRAASSRTALGADDDSSSAAAASRSALSRRVDCKSALVPAGRCGAFRQPGSGDAEVGAVGGAGTGPRDAAAADATAAGELCPGAGTNDAWVRTCPVGSRRGGCGALRSRPTATTPMMRGGGCGAGDTGVAAGAARATSSGV